MRISPVSTAKTVLTCPMRVFADDSLPNRRGCAGAIIRMKIFLPETELTLAVGRLVAKQAAKTLRPGKVAAFYIPIPNCIVRSPGKE